MERLSSRLDAFESISFGNILPGGLVDSKRGDRDGGKGLMRLLSVVVSSIWMVGRCETLGEDTVRLYFLSTKKRN